MQIAHGQELFLPFQGYVWTVSVCLSSLPTTLVRYHWSANEWSSESESKRESILFDIAAAAAATTIPSTARLARRGNRKPFGTTTSMATTNATASPARELRLGEEAIGGLSAGILGTIIGFPLDLIKTRLQTGSTTSSSTKPSILSVGKDIVRREGIPALYKGVGPPLVSLSILNTTTFIQYAWFQKAYGAQFGWDGRNFWAGVSCAPFSGLVSTVENLVKTQMQLDNLRGKARYRGSWHCCTSLIKAHGLGIVYTGHAVNTVREMAFIGPYFFLYEGLRETLLRKQDRLREHLRSGDSGSVASFLTNRKLAIPLAGGLSGAASWFLSFPLDCLRAGVQGQAMPPTKGAPAILRELVRQRGLKGLYAGSSASIARAFLVSGSRFSAYEGALWLLRGGR